MTLEELRPFVRGAAHMEWTWLARDYSVAFDCRIFAIAKGTALLYTESGEHRLTVGDLVFFAPGVPYRFANVGKSQRFSAYVVNLDLDMSRTDIPTFIQPTAPKFFDPSQITSTAIPPELPSELIVNGASALLPKLAELHTEFTSPSEYSRLRLSAMATELILLMLRHRDASTSRNRLINRIKRLVRENCSEQLSNKQIAAKLGYNPLYVSRVFAESECMTLREYVNDFRLNLGMQMLITTDQPIAQIALACGFSTASHFTIRFKEKYGRLPSELRTGGMI